MIQVQKIDNEADEFNVLSTHSESEIVVYTSGGNFHVYKTENWDQPLKHQISYLTKNSIPEDNTDMNKRVIEFENEKMKEVSTFKLYRNYLIVTYWDSDRGKIFSMNFYLS